MHLCDHQIIFSKTIDIPRFQSYAFTCEAWTVAGTNRYSDVQERTRHVRWVEGRGRRDNVRASKLFSFPSFPPKVPKVQYVPYSPTTSQLTTYQRYFLYNLA